MWRWYTNFPGSNFLICVWCHTSKGRGDFAVGLNFEFFYLMYESFFLSFKITPHSSKLIKAFKFYNWKRTENSSYWFLYYFLKFYPFHVLHYTLHILGIKISQHFNCKGRLTFSEPSPIFGGGNWPKGLPYFDPCMQWGGGRIWGGSWLFWWAERGGITFLMSCMQWVLAMCRNIFYIHYLM